MKKNNKTSKHEINIAEQKESKQENGIVITGATKQCPHCEEDLPEKIAFCLYCMKSLVGDSAPQPEAKQQNNGGNPFQKTSTKVLVGAAALLAVVAIIVATSFITASILSRQGTGIAGYIHHPPVYTPFVPQDDITDSALTPEPTPTPESLNIQQSAEVYPAPTPVPSYTQETEANTTTPTSDSSQRGNRPSNPAISLDRAIEIGYEELTRRGHTGTFRTDSGMDWEHGQWVWELLFRVEGGRLPLVEMYINVDTGEIVKFEWDD